MPEPSYGVRQLVQELKQARIALGLSQRELAGKAGISQPRLARIEKGDVDLRADTLLQVARSLDLEVVLAPRRTLPAVQSLIQPPLAGSHMPVDSAQLRRLRRISATLATLRRKGLEGEAVPAAAELASNLVLRLQHGWRPGPEAARIVPHAQRLTARLRAVLQTSTDHETASRITAELLEDLRQLDTLAGTGHDAPPEQTRGAFSMEDD